MGHQGARVVGKVQIAVDRLGAADRHIGIRGNTQQTDVAGDPRDLPAVIAQYKRNPHLVAVPQTTVRTSESHYNFPCPAGLGFGLARWAFPDIRRRLRRLRRPFGTLMGFDSLLVLHYNTKMGKRSKIMENPEELKRFLQEVPQIVPEEYCFRCKICCRFPDTQNVQTPFWSEGESRLARNGPGSEDWFPAIPGTVSRGVRLKRCGEGYRCPAFDPQTSRCTIHGVKPMDCRLYPFVLTASPGGSEVILAMDMKCPYLQDHHGDSEVSAYARRLEIYLSSPQALSYLRSNPKILGPSWPEYVAVAGLPAAAPLIQEGLPTVLHPRLRAVGPEDWRRLEEAFHLKPHAFSGYSRAALAGWQDVVRLYLAEWDGALALFSEQTEGWFMPLPPLSRTFQPKTARKAWELLTELNRGSGVSRVEGIEAGEARRWEAAGFRIRPSQMEYLYRRESLVDLRGGGYRSKRWSINRFLRQNPFPCRIRSFEEADLTACLQLYTRWAIEKQKRSDRRDAKTLVRDGLFFHRQVLMHPREWGLAGLVAEIEGRVAAYTFGAALSGRIFCVFVEIADPQMPGLGGFLFREFCRRMEGYAFVNAMGDEGLEGLRRSKQSYRPLGFVRSYAAEYAKP